MVVHHPDWVRTCRNCKTYVHGTNGKISTEPGKDASGRAIELPMLMSKWKMQPPCGVCPKLENTTVKEPLDEATDFGDWFWDVWDSYREGKACGFPSIDPVIRACYAIIAEAEAARDKKNDTNTALNILTLALKQARA